ncbi:Polysaccharide biosynthesis protein [Chitinophaga sp. 180180018-2]|nr:Polysaccharide biosynthesis protein [Chitinophaga sp. 212800010-3]
MKINIGDRAGNLLKGSITSVIPRGIGFLYTILIIPLIISSLGKDALGVWLTIVSIVDVLNFADFGITNNIINLISKTNLEKDSLKEKNITSTCVFVISVIAITIFFIYFFGKGMVNWANILGIHNNDLLRQALKSLDILILYFLINFPLVIYQKIRYAIQERHYLNYYEGFGKMISIILVFGGIQMYLPLSGLIMMYVLGPVIGQIVNTITLLYNKPQFIPDIKFINRGSLKEIFGASIYFFLINVSYLFYTSLDNILISNILNAGEAASFASVQKVYLIFPMLFALATPSLWVANREAFLQKDHIWLNKVFNKGILINVCSLFFLVLLSLLLNGGFFTWFTDGKIIYDQWMVTVISINAATMISYNFFSAFFIAIDEMQNFALMFLAFSILSFLLKIYALPRIGITDTYMINSILFIVIFFMPCFILLKRKIVKI